MDEYGEISELQWWGISEWMKLRLYIWSLLAIIQSIRKTSCLASVMSLCILLDDANEAARSEGHQNDKKQPSRTWWSGFGWEVMRKRGEEEEEHHHYRGSMTQLRTMPPGRKAKGTDNRANSHADKHTCVSFSAKTWTSSTVKGKARYKPGHAEVRWWQAQVIGVHIHTRTHTYMTEEKWQKNLRPHTIRLAFSLPVTYIHHIRGMKGLFLLHSRDWQADSQPYLLLFLCPAVSPQLSKL